MDAVQAAKRVVSTRTPKAIPKNVKLQVEGGTASLLATDGETGLWYVIRDAEADGSGEVLLPAARVLQILRELTDRTIELEITGDAVRIRGGYNEFRLDTENPADFPSVAAFDDDNYFVIPAGSLRRMIRRTVFATDAESTRYALNGVLAEFTPERATLAATDARRLAVVTAPCRAEGKPQLPSGQTVVPTKAMNLLERVLADVEGDVRLAVHANDIVAQAGEVTISSQLVQGRFPDYRKVIPQQFQALAELAVKPFYSAIRQAQIKTDDGNPGVDFTFERGLLRLSSQAAKIGQSKIDLPINYEGPALTVRFNPRYIADFLRALGANTTVRFQLNDSESPAMLLTDDQYAYLIMPMSQYP